MFPVRGFRCSELGFWGVKNELKIPYLGGGKRKSGTGTQAKAEQAHRQKRNRHTGQRGTGEQAPLLPPGITANIAVLALRIW